MCFEQWIYASSTFTMTQRSGFRHPPTAISWRTSSGTSGLFSKAAFSMISALPLTCKPTVLSKKSTKIIPM